MRETVRKETILQERLDQILKQVAFCFHRNFPVGKRLTAEMFQERHLFSANGNKRVQMVVGDIKAGSDISWRRKYVFNPRKLGDKNSSMPKGRETFVRLSVFCPH
jgi:hypothetical protein